MGLGGFGVLETLNPKPIGLGVKGFRAAENL